MQVSGSIRIPFVVNGVGIESVAEEYALHTSATEAPTSGWGTSIQNPTKEQPYLWNRETTTYTDGTTRTVPAHVVAMYSEDGRGIKDITNYYLASDQSSGITNANAYFTESIQTITPEKPYLWNYEKVTYDDDTAYKTPACIIGIYGLSGITFNIPQSVVIPAGTRTATFIIGAYRDGVQLVTDLSQVTVPTSTPTGYSAAKRSASSDGVTCEYTRDSDTRTDVGSAVWGLTLEGVTYNITIGVSGLTSPISIDAYPDSLVFADGATTADHYVHLLNGTAVVGNGNYTPSLGSAPSGTSVALASGTYNSKSGYRIRFTRTSTSTVVDGDFTYTITYNEVSITRTVHVMSPANDGADAVTYELVASTQNLVWYPARGAYSPETITLTYYKITGSTRTAQNAYWSGNVTLYNGTANGNTVTINSSDAGQTNATSGTSQYVFRPSSCSAVVQAINITASATSSTSDSSAKTFSLQATSSCAIRYQNWTDVATGFSFECGAVGDTYIDIVYYNGSCYQCKADHTKSTASAYVPSTSGSAYWTGVNTFKNVATDLLLAQTAKIENLYVDDVYMETSDGKTAIWINPALEGMLIRKLADLTTTGRENQTASDWSNPTAAFTAGTLKEVYGTNGVYGSVSTFTSSTYRPSFSFTSQSGGDTLSASIIQCATGQVTSGLTVGTVAHVTIQNNITVTIKEGLTLKSSGTLSQSQALFEMRYATSASALTTSGSHKVAWSLNASGFGVNNSTRTITKNDTQDLSFVVESSNLFFGVYLVYYSATSGGSISMSGTYNVSGYTVASNYVAQYTAGGVFVGLSSQDYSRFALNSLSEVQHTLLAGGNGIDITPNASYQYKMGMKMPLGYALLAGYFSPDGRTLNAQYWTFDDSDLAELEYPGVGWYVLTLPASWSSSEGFNLSSGMELCITATVHRDNDSTGAYAKVNNIDGRVISITTHDADGTITDFPFFLRVDYFPSNKSMSVAYTTRTTSLSETEDGQDIEEAQAELLEDKQEKEE